MINKEFFKNQILEGWSVKELQEFYGLSRTSIYRYKEKWNLTGISPNGKTRDFDSGVKVCKTCNKEKALSEFYSNGYYASGTKKYKPNCKECQKSLDVDNRLNKIKEILKELNKPLECENCGYNKNIAALCFHHIKPEEKEFSLSELSKTANIEIMKNEISKCSLLCHNCHMEEHYPHLNL